jgi:enamine deaminase RidA (YjgF/YER057c/UK114 family)
MELSDLWIGAGESLHRARRKNGFLFLSGIVSTFDTGSIEVQTEDILNQLNNSVLEAGHPQLQLTWAWVAIRSETDFKKFNGAWRTWFRRRDQALPCRTTVQSSPIPPGALVEVTGIAS